MVVSPLRRAGRHPNAFDAACADTLTRLRKIMHQHSAMAGGRSARAPHSRLTCEFEFCGAPERRTAIMAR
jgi:hypothetical protein